MIIQKQLAATERDISIEETVGCISGYFWKKVHQRQQFWGMIWMMRNKIWLKLSLERSIADEKKLWMTVYMNSMKKFLNMRLDNIDVLVSE